MFLTIKKFPNVENQCDVIQKVQDGLIPYIRGFPGFINYYSTKFEDGDLGSISIFISKAHADRSAANTAAWIEQNLGVNMPGDPQVLRATVLLQARDLSVASPAK